MTLGTQNRKSVIALAILGVGALYGVYNAFLAGPDVPSTADRPAAAASSPAPGGGIESSLPVPATAPRKPVARGTSRGRTRDDSLHFVYVAVRPEDRPDVTRIDPTLHLEMLAKVQEVEPAGGHRNLFAFGAPPPPKPVELPKGPEKKIDLKAAAPPPPPKAGGPGDGKPAEVPLQVNLQYYGIVAPTHGGKKTACFRDGDDILLANEGDTLKRRYRVVRIGTTTVVMEDTESKRQATLPLAKEAEG